MYIREAGARLSFGMEASNRNMRKSVVYKTGVNAQLAAHYETCIQELKRKGKRSNRNKDDSPMDSSDGVSSDEESMERHSHELQYEDYNFSNLESNEMSGNPDSFKEDKLSDQNSSEDNSSANSVGVASHDDQNTPKSSITGILESRVYRHLQDQPVSRLNTPCESESY